MPTIYEVVANWVAEDTGEPFLPRTEPVRPSAGEQWDEWMRQLGNMWEIPSVFARPAGAVGFARIPTRPNWWNQLSNSEAVRRFRHQQRQETMLYGDGAGVEPTRENAPYLSIEDILDVQRRFNAVFNDVERAARLGDGSGELAYRGGQPVGLPLRPDHYRVRGGQCACGFTSPFSGDMDSHLATGLHLCHNCALPTDNPEFAITHPHGPTLAVRWCTDCLSNGVEVEGEVSGQHEIAADHRDCKCGMDFGGAYNRVEDHARAHGLTIPDLIT